jgi:transcription antitermination protein NusB
MSASRSIPARANTKSEPELGRRHESRERALALLYEAEARGLTVDEVLAELPLAPEEFAARLISGVQEHSEEIDALISAKAEGWDLDRMPAIDRAILRVAIFELTKCDDIPTGATIDEAVELAKRYSTDDSGRFVNGLLSRLAEDYA